jgi:hypothetical protein
MPTSWKSTKDEKGSRVYQIILKKMQVLPMSDTSKGVLLSATVGKGSTKGKRKASKDLSARGKKHVGLEVDDGNFEMLNSK